MLRALTSAKRSAVCEGPSPATGDSSAFGATVENGIPRRARRDRRYCEVDARMTRRCRRDGADPGLAVVFSDIFLTGPANRAIMIRFSRLPQRRFQRVGRR